MTVNRNSTIYRVFTALLLLAGSALAHAAGLTDLSGKPATVQDFLGKDKWTVVIFWRSDCHICGVKAPEYAMLHEDNEDKNYRVLGITNDGLENKADAEGFINEHQLKFPNLIGTPETVAGLYYDEVGDNWVGTPTVFIYNPEGRLRAAQPGGVPAQIIEDFISENS